MKKLYPILTALSVGAFALFAQTSQAFAVTSISTIQPSGGINSPSVTGGLSSLFSNLGTAVINIVLILATIIAVAYLIYSGIQYVTAGGDPEKAKKARGAIINAVIGIIVIAGAFVIINFALNLGSAAGTTLNNAQNGTNVTNP